MSVLVFGSINIDLTAYAARLPRPGETIHGDRYVLGLGGKGANQAAAVARLGTAVRMVGRVGADAFGRTALSELARYGVACDLIGEDTVHATGVAVIGVDAAGENCITVIGGANMAVDISDVARCTDALKSARVLLLQLEVPLDAALAAASTVRSGGGLVILDPAPAPAGGLPEAVLGHVDVLTPNETETEALIGFRPQSPEEGARAAEILHRKGGGIAIVKLGARGVCFHSAEEAGFVPPFSVKAIDSVAAGDCFNGGLGHALAEGMPLPLAIRYAAACGALATTRRGAAASAPTSEEVRSLLS